MADSQFPARSAFGLGRAGSRGWLGAGVLLILGGASSACRPWEDSKNAPPPAAVPAISAITPNLPPTLHAAVAESYALAADPGFGIRGRAAYALGADAMDLQGAFLAADGTTFVTGAADFSGDFQACALHLLADGALDPRFGNGGRAKLGQFGGKGEFVAEDAQHRLIVVGHADKGSSSPLFVARLKSTGEVDPDFGVVFDDFGASEVRPVGLSVAPDGRISILGGLYRSGTRTIPFLFRLDAKGQPEPGFGDRGLVPIDVFHDPVAGSREKQLVSRAAFLADGSALLCGERKESAFMVKIDKNGAVDRSFGDGGFTLLPGLAHVRGLAPSRDGQILLGGESKGRMVATRISSLGILDTSFGHEGYAVGPNGHSQQAEALIAARDGSPLLLGFDEERIFWIHFDKSGVIDPAFGHGGIALGHEKGEITTSAASDSLGRVVVVGSRGHVGLVYRFVQPNDGR